ncbi:hypothetical protein C8K30_10546 [Promicromonospora sp. AC04]|uniref:peptide ligase PGM1-related protein n=1 Tax=Promicromonospora sp. AC04 TaxID=2135723 RepID=UPI000D4DD0B5|nr:peptide ligase PGM1-related protein [Promicromonospora sp. AC04]PUB26819.1 hypothetical protein C8K30_10546 [Promicromonospora sp. AC04]
MGAFNSQARLARARSANQPRSRVPHTVVVLPSYSVDPSLLAQYGARIPALEHRQLLTMLMLPRVPESEMIFVTAKAPTERVLEYYLSFVPADRRNDTRARIRLVEVPDPTPRSITSKLLDRPDLMARIRTMTSGRLAYIEPWNVTQLEMDVARRLGLPLNGTAPRLWPLGFKSNGRRIMRSAGVPIPLGQEDVRSVADVLAAAEAIRRQHPDAAGVVIKLDNSGTGHGNRVVRFASSPTAAELRAVVESLEPWYLSDLAGGAVVEELVTGHEFASPSVQVDIAPVRHVEVISTHEQFLGGAGGQVYLGCRFPANPDYGSHLMSYGKAVGELLADQGAMGRFCVDFAATRSPSSGWQVHGLEINLRKTGTSHPLSLLHNLVPGHYDAETGSWSAEDGSERCYRSTDNVVDPAWRGRAADDVIDAVRSAGLEFDPRSGVGAILHSFVGLDIDGRIGLTTIGRSPDHAERLHRAAVAAMETPASRHDRGLPETRDTPGSTLGSGGIDERQA